MKIKIFVVLLISTLGFISFISTSSAVANPSTEGARIGDVRISVLPPAIFEEDNSGWVLMDGRNVEGSAYAERTLIDTVPNSKNRFIRGMGGTYNFADGEGLNGRPREVGSFQTFSTAEPTGGLSVTGGNHVHPYQLYYSDGTNTPAHVDPSPGEFGTYLSKTQETSGEGGHSHTSGDWDNETRPDNISLYFYIKIQ
jgi:hypothetical protein